VIWVRATQSRLLSASVPSIKGWTKDAGKWTQGSPILWRLNAPGIDFEMQLVGLDDASAVDRVMGADTSIVVIDEGAELADLRGVLSRLLTRCGRYPAQREGGISTGVRAIIISNKSAVGSDLHKLCMSERPPTLAYFDAVAPILEDGTVNPAAPTAHLPPRYYEDLAVSLTEDQRAVLLENRWGLVSHGRPVIPEFKSTVHVARRKLAPPAGVKLRLAVDPGHNPAAILGWMVPTPQGNRWEIGGELVAERITSVKFAHQVKEWLARNWPGGVIESAVIDPAAYHPSDRDDEQLIADLYSGILGVKFKPAASPLLDVLIEAGRLPFSQLVDGVPAILLDPSMTVTAESLSSRFVFREAVSGLEKVTTDMIVARHPWHDAAMSLLYLLASSGYADLRAFVRAKRPQGSSWTSRCAVCRNATCTCDRPFGW
jgi:hypothetical protein